MRMDIFLDARWTLSPVFAEDRMARAVIASSIGYVPPQQRPGNRASYLEVNAVSVSVGQWENMPGLHDWLAQHLRQPLIGAECALDGAVLDDLETAIGQAKASGNSALRDCSEEEIGYTLEVINAARRLRESGWELFITAWC